MKHYNKFYELATLRFVSCILLLLTKSSGVEPTAQSATAPSAGICDDQRDDQQYDDKMNLALRDLIARRRVFRADDVAAVVGRWPKLNIELDPPNSSVIEDGELYRRAVNSTLALYSNTESSVSEGGGAQLGAAFVISTSGIAITCFHAMRFNGPFVLDACTVGGRELNVKSILAVYPRQDIAFLQLDGKGFEPLPLRLDAPAGIQIRELGHPLSAHFFMEQGLLARYQLLPLGSGGKTTAMRAELAVNAVSGFSGGPVIDMSGNIVGISQSMRSITRGGETFSMAVAIPAAIISSCILGNYHETLTGEEQRKWLLPDSH